MTTRQQHTNGFLGRARAVLLLVALAAVAVALTQCSSPTPTILEGVSVVTADPILDAEPTDPAARATGAVTETAAHYPRPIASRTPVPAGYLSPDR